MLKNKLPFFIRATQKSKTWQLGDRLDNKATFVGYFDSVNPDTQATQRYAYFVVDSAYRTGATQKWSIYATAPEGYPTYGTQELAEAAKESATWNTQKIIDTANSSYQAFFTARQFSLTYNGTTYYGQMPNIYELEQVYVNRIALDGYDPTINTDNNLTDWKFGGVASNVWSSTALASNIAYRITTFGSVSSGTTTNAAALIPIIEIPV